MALRHGAFSKRMVEPVAVELVQGLLDDRADLAAYPEVVHAWARAEAKVLLLDDWLTTQGLHDEAGEPRAALNYLAKFMTMADRLRQRLGLDPRSEAELARERGEATRVTADLESLLERGRQVSPKPAASTRVGEADGGS
ncbi:MAG: hypothetical protein M5U31_04965 [Acidimicrobiia bacterium]|nr:hypothetical protein [Acidimicrobiia bacterium]